MLLLAGICQESVLVTMEAVFAPRSRDLFSTTPQAKTFYYPTTAVRDEGKDQVAIETLQRRMFEQKSSCSPSSHSTSSPGEVAPMWDFKLEGSSGTGSSSPASSRFDETWPSRSDEGGEKGDERGCRPHGGEREGVATDGEPREEGKNVDNEREGTTLARYIERFRSGPPTSRDSRGMPDQQFWWREAQKPKEVMMLKPHPQDPEATEDKSHPAIDSSPKTSSSDDSLLSRSQDILDRSSMCLVSSLESAESPPAMKYWNTRAKQSPHVALPDTQKMARLASSERFHKREPLSPSEDILAQWRLRRKLDQARAESRMLSQQKDCSGQRGVSEIVKTSHPEDLKRRFCLSCRTGQERENGGVTGSEDVEEVCDRERVVLHDERQVMETTWEHLPPGPSEARHADNNGGDDGVSVREMEVQTSPRLLRPGPDSIDGDSHRTGAVEVGLGTCACVHRSGVGPVKEMSREGNMRRLHTAHGEGTGLGQVHPGTSTIGCQSRSVSQSPAGSGDGLPLLSRQPHASFIGHTLLGKLTQNAEQEKCKRREEEETFVEATSGDYVRKSSKPPPPPPPPHGGLALRDCSPLDEGDDLLTLSLTAVTDFSSCTTPATTHCNHNMPPSSTPAPCRSKREANNSEPLSPADRDWQQELPHPPSPTPSPSFSPAGSSSKTERRPPQKQSSPEALAWSSLRCCDMDDDLLKLLITKAKFFEAQIRDIDYLLMAFEAEDQRPLSRPRRSSDC